MLLARLGLCAYLLALALAASAAVDARDLPAETSIAADFCVGDGGDELIADDDDLDDDDDELGVDGDDDAVSAARVKLPAPARLDQRVATECNVLRPSVAVDDLFRPPRSASV
jgi:hypothetical protein